MITFSLQPGNPLIIYGYGTSDNLLLLNGTQVSVFGTTTPGILPPLVTPTIPRQPSDPEFNYLELPRLSTFTSDSIITNVNETQLIVTIGGQEIDLSDNFLNGDYAKPISGASVGKVTLGQLANSVLLKDIPLDFGVPIIWRQCWNGACETVMRGYILSSPSIDSSDGYIKYIVNIGDELALKSDTSRVPTRKYCGTPPDNAKEAAQIYATYHNLFTRTYPDGHELLDLTAQAFTNDRPYDFLQALYAPTNQDVRCNNSGIIVVPRPSFDANNALTIAKEQAIDVKQSFNQSYAPLVKLKVSNTYSLVNPFSIRTESFTTVSGLANNTKPWFQGGYTQTVTTKAYLGVAEVWSKEVVYGYLPVGNAVTEAQYNEDPCSNSTIDTIWGIVSTKLKNSIYTRHKSGAYLVNEVREYFTAKTMEKALPFYVMREDLQSYSTTEYLYTAQINNEVCSKDYIHITHYTRTKSYAIKKDYSAYILTKDSITSYTVKGTSNLNTNSYVGTGQTWVKTEVAGEYDSESDNFIIQPAREEEVSSPPGANWIRPSKEEILAKTEVSLNLPGSLEQRPLEAPFCYTLSQLNTFGTRFLREHHGLYRGKILVVPFYFDIRLGDSVWYDNEPYLVYSIEINQTLEEVTKTILLSYWVG